MATSIEWAQDVWNPIAGCTRISPGCANCYAIKMSARLGHMSRALKKKGGNAGRLAAYEGLSDGKDWTGGIRLIEEAIDIPSKTRKPTRFFVNSMSDLFHDEVPVEWIGRIFQQMRKHNHHQYIVLTKRPERAAAICGFAPIAEYYKHICIGVSICTQEEFDRIYPIWRKTHIACRAISFEPLLSPIQVSDLSGIDWAIVGGESGSGSRPFRSDWARTLLAASRKSNTRFFFKQLGQNSDLPVHKKGGDFADIPADLRVRELPLGWQ